MARLTPTLAQSVGTLRNDGTLALPGAPTVGNLMVVSTAGYLGSLLSYAPTNFQRVYYYGSDANNGVALWMRRVQSGDTSSYALSAGDNQAAVIYEFQNAAGAFPIAGGAMSSFFSGSSFSMPVPRSPIGQNDVIVGAFENDSALTFSITSETGLSVDYQTTAEFNHTGAFFRADATHDGIMAGTLSGSPNNPAFGLFAIAGAFA